MDLADIPILDEFVQVADFARYVELPEDWWVAVADVQGSTVAIRAGRYKDVNLLGVTAIAAMVNAVRPLRIPFVFGGDGASFCLPSAAVPAARAALASVRMLGQEAFGLDLRIGLIPLSAIRAEGKRVLVAFFRSSPTYLQAVFAGGGMSCAERLLKDEALGARFAIADQPTAAGADCSGLECRWNEITSPHGETVALLVQTMGSAAPENYHATISTIDRIYGGARRSHPVTTEQLHLGRGAAAVRGELQVRTHQLSRLRTAMYGLNLRFEQFAGRFLMRRGWRFDGVDWGGYKDEVIANTDWRKFDDTLRIVLSGTADQRLELEAWLAERHQAGVLAYGLHVAPAALMTCLIGDRAAGDHVHFVDGANGGYAMAALDLKRRLAG